MARNKVQYQKGLSEAEFDRQYGSEEQCRAALANWRWPDGFVCPHCGARRHSVISEIPKTPTGKVQKFRLRQTAREIA